MAGGERQNKSGAARIIRKGRPMEDDEAIAGPWDRRLFLATGSSAWYRSDIRGSHDAIGQRNEWKRMKTLKHDHL